VLYGMRIMCYDRARERTHRRLMRLYYLLGDRAEALRQYERCAAALEEELGVNTSKSTVAIYRQIQADQLDVPTSTLVDVDIAGDLPASPLLEILSHLAHLQRSLSDLQNQVEKGIEMVKIVLQNNQ